MFRRFVLCLIVPSLLIGASSAQSSGSISIRAYMDGRSHLILDGSTVQWRHFDFAAPGRLNCHEGAPIEPTFLEGLAWFPDWADVPDCENRFCGGCFSSVYTELSSTLPEAEFLPSLSLVEARGPCTVAESPSAANGYRVVIQLDDNSWHAGAWYELVLSWMSSGGQNYCASLPNSTGAPALIGATGTFSVAANDLVLIATGLPAHQNGLFFYGRHPAQIPFANGYLCVSPFGGGLVRAVQVASGAGGFVEQPIDYAALPPGGAILPGSTWYFQLWYRDPHGGGARSNLTDGVQLLFAP